MSEQTGKPDSQRKRLPRAPLTRLTILPRMRAPSDSAAQLAIQRLQLIRGNLPSNPSDSTLPFREVSNTDSELKLRSSRLFSDCQKVRFLKSRARYLLIVPGSNIKGKRDHPKFVFLSSRSRKAEIVTFHKKQR